MADIVISEHMELSAVESLARDFDVLFDPDLVNQPEALRAALKDARALLVRNITQVRGDLLQAAVNLRVVGRLGVGLDNIDLEACAARNIQVFPATGANTDSVAELVIGALFVLFRRAYHASDKVLSGAWPRLTLGGREIQGHHLGLVGFGAIARAVALRAKPLGMTLSAYDPLVPADDPAWKELSVTPSSFEDLLTDSDAISLHVPLIDETRHMIDAAAIAKMKPDAILINAARGGVVVEQALADALRDERLGGAFLDVFEQEPVKAGSVLEGVPNLILAPHIGAMTDESNVRVSFLTADNVRKALAGSVKKV
ncbi:MAG: hydroxyacid dehydrogenase [Rhodospirillales bacterium]|nr:hydroxyacid dehydrogenase [Rhodospirillales bacterium]